MFKLRVEITLDEPTKMAAAATLRRAFLSSTVDIRSYRIVAIDLVDEAPSREMVEACAEA